MRVNNSLIIFVFILSLSTMVRAGEVESLYADTLRSEGDIDLFNNITDISRQINQRTTNQNIVPAQPATITPVPSESVIVRSTPPMRNPLDSMYTRNHNGILTLPPLVNQGEALSGLSFSDTLFYNPLFLPMIFTGRMLPRDLSFYSTEDNSSRGTLIPENKTFAPALRHADFIQSVRSNYYKTNPDRIKYSVANFDSIPYLGSGDEVVRETFNPFKELIKTETTYSLEAPGVEGATIDRKYWVYEGEHSFQFAQNYFSSNWHKGGTNNLNFNSIQIVRANYKKEKVRFDNTLEWRLSVYNAPDDSVRHYRIGNDLIRYYGDFGLTSFMKGWSYSMNTEAKSQLFNNYNPNSTELRSALLAPLYVNAGIGLKYELDKKSEKVRHRRVKWTLNLAPVSINYKYVGNNKVDVKRFGIPEGRRSLLDIGSTITSILKYDFTRYITWDSRWTYFTSYKKVVSEFENSLNMSLSNAFSTRIYTNVRFDDGVPSDPDFKYWQVNQTLSFGLNYKW